MAAKPLTVKEILEITSDDLKQVMTDIGEDPRGMNKTAMQDFLVQQITKPDSLPKATDIQVTTPADGEKLAGETPAFVSALSVPVLRVQSSVRPAGKPGSSTEAVCSLGQLLHRDRRTLRVSGVSYERN